MRINLLGVIIDINEKEKSTPLLRKRGQRIIPVPSRKERQAAIQRKIKEKAMQFSSNGHPVDENQAASKPKRGRPKKSESVAPPVDSAPDEGLVYVEPVCTDKIGAKPKYKFTKTSNNSIHPAAKVAPIDSAAESRKMNTCLMKSGIEGWGVQNASGNVNRIIFELSSYGQQPRWNDVSGKVVDLGFEYGGRGGTLKPQGPGVLVWSKSKQERQMVSARYTYNEPYRFEIVDNSGLVHAVDWSKGPHLLVAGMTDSGKTVTAMSVIAQLLTTFTKDNYGQVMILNADFEPGSLGLEVFEGCKRVPLFLSGTSPNNCDALNYIMEIIEHRAEIRGSGAFEPLIVVVDEIDTFFTNNPHMKDILNKILVRGRKYNVRIIACTQSGRSSVMSGAVKQGFGVVLLHRVKSQEAARIIIGESCELPAHKLEGNGEMFVVTSTSEQRGQAPLINIEVIKNFK